MSATSVRLLIAFAMIVALPGLYIPLFVVIEEVLFSRDEVALTVACLVLGAAFAVCWVLIWRKAVSWTAGRAVLTALAWPVAAAAGSLFGLVFAAASHEEEVAVIVAGMLALAIWIAATACIWRETPAERVARRDPRMGSWLTCPRCGYSMKGLREARCPECGTQYTLDELLLEFLGDPEKDESASPPPIAQAPDRG
jgi:hypothetical protein